MKRAPIIEQVVAAATQVAFDGDEPARRVKLLPIGRIEMRDGRGPYLIRDAAHAQAVVAATRTWLGSADMMFDYDHQVAFGAQPGVGGQAKASGWIRPDTLRVEGDGIYGDVDCTAAAVQQLKAREYRYLSPLFMAAKGTGEVTLIKNVALVNIGAIDLPAIAAALSTTEETDDMDLKAIAALLGLSADATEEQVTAAIADLKKPSTSVIAVAAGLAASATTEEVAAAVADIKANYVPKSIVDPMKVELQRLRADRLGKQVDELVAAGVIMPAKHKEVLDWFEKDEVAAAAFFKDMPAIVAGGSQLDGRKPGEKFTSLSADEVAACAAIGQSHEEYLKAKNEEIA